MATRKYFQNNKSKGCVPRTFPPEIARKKGTTYYKHRLRYVNAIAKKIGVSPY